jgi:predicted PurR-regulated permease PerM
VAEGLLHPTFVGSRSAHPVADPVGASPTGAPPPASRETADASQPEAQPARSLRDLLAAIAQTTVSLRLVPVLLVIALLWWAQAVLIPVVMSILVSNALEPAVARLEKWGVSRVIGVPFLLIVLAAGCTAAIYPLRGQAITFANRLPDATRKITRAIRQQASDALNPVAKVREAATEIERATATGPTRRPGDAAPVRIEEPPFRADDWLLQGSHGALELAIQLFAIACLVYYLLIAGDSFKRKFVRIVGPSLSSKKMTVQILAEIDRQIARFLWARVMISIVVGAAMWLSLHALGVEQPGVWAVLSAFLFTIPVVGHVVVTLAVAVAGFVQFNSLTMAGTVGGVTGLIAALEGNWLTPWLMSRVGDMNAVAVFVCLLFWGWLWGIWGLLLAVPITAAVKVVCERVDALNPVAEILKSDGAERA